MASGNSSNDGGLFGFINGDVGSAQSKQGITTKAFVLNIAISLGLFLFQITGFFLLKSSDIGRRIYQPKTYLVQDRLRVEPVPANPFRWIRRIFIIDNEELKVKCGLDGYFFIRFIRALLIIFLPLMAIIVTILLPINYNDGKGSGVFIVGGHPQTYNVTGLDTLSWQNVAPTQTNRYWAHLVCALLAISWTLYRIYREKLHFIDVRHEFLVSPEHRLKSSARTMMVTNIPSEYRSKEALKALYDVFVDNDDRSKLIVWLNRDYGLLKTLATRRRKLLHALEKEELRILRLVNKQNRGDKDIEADQNHSKTTTEEATMLTGATEADMTRAVQPISPIFEQDCQENEQLWRKYLKPSAEAHMTVEEDEVGSWRPVSQFKFWRGGGRRRQIPKIAWLRAEIARLNLQLEELSARLDDETKFKRQNSAFIQFDRQMSAHMACSLVSHHRLGRMAPRFIDVAPHEIIWANTGVTSSQRLVRTCIALVLFVAMIFLWGLPTTFLGILSQLDSVRNTTSWLSWLRSWPSYAISLISGPLASILLALLIQLVVPALCRKLAVLMGSPTRSKREVVTQDLYFTFLFIELVLVTSISSGIVATIPAIVDNPSSIATTLATDLPKAANYFFNYLIVQALGFSGSILFQYLRLLYITTIWPWFTQTPREEAWLQMTIPHQMWGNVYPLMTNFAVIGLIYSIVAPLMLIFVSITFTLFWFGYRHNYYFVQRNKVDSHGALFNNALSQLLAGVYVLEFTLIGLFFLVRDSDANVACTAQAVIMIVALAFTVGFHCLLEQYLRPLYELLPVTLEDRAADAERKRFLEDNDSKEPNAQNEVRESASLDVPRPSTASEKRGRAAEPDNRSDGSAKGRTNGAQMNGVAGIATNGRNALGRVKKRTTARIADLHSHAPIQIDMSRRHEVAEKLKASIGEFPDELTDLSPEERDALLKASYQDPVTREPPPIVWLPRDPSGISEDAISQVKKYGRSLQYSNAGAYLTKKQKCEVTQPAPDVRPDWLLDWVL